MVKNREALYTWTKAWKKAKGESYWKDKYLKTKYGLTLKEYYEMESSQNGVCAICKGRSTDKSLAVDHCHETGKIRGLLCDRCNIALGLIYDRIDIANSIVRYLQIQHT